MGGRWHSSRKMRNEYVYVCPPIHVVIGVELGKSINNIYYHMFFVLLSLSLSQLIAGILGAEKVHENASTSFHIDPLLA
jgi:hypothetical protein